MGTGVEDGCGAPYSFREYNHENLKGFEKPIRVCFRLAQGMAASIAAYRAED